VKFTHSPEIAELLTELARRKQLKLARELGVWSSNTSRTHYVMEFAQVLSAKYGGNLPDMVYGAAQTSDTTVFFDEPEAVIVAKLKAVKPKKRGKTAPKVLVRMIYRRLLDLKKSMDNFAEMKADEQARAAANPQNAPAKLWTDQYEVPELTKETMVDLTTFAKVLPATRQHAKEVKDVATREDVTDEIRDLAWGLFEAHLIMES